MLLCYAAVLKNFAHIILNDYVLKIGPIKTGHICTNCANDTFARY